MAEIRIGVIDVHYDYYKRTIETYLSRLSNISFAERVLLLLTIVKYMMYANRDRGKYVGNDTINVTGRNVLGAYDGTLRDFARNLIDLRNDLCHDIITHDVMRTLNILLKDERINMIIEQANNKEKEESYRSSVNNAISKMIGE